MNNREKSKSDKKFIRVNFHIRAPQVRVTQDGNQLGIMPVDKARNMAMEAGLDLVEVVPNATPPVCAILDFGKYRYEQKIKEKEARRRNKSVELKEVRLKPQTHEHDIQVKVAAVKRFILDGKKVLVSLRYKNRQMMHKEEGFRVMDRVIVLSAEFANVEQKPRLEGYQLTCRLEPKAAGDQNAKN